MDRLLYLIARVLIAGLQALPLRVVARLGRTGGAVAYALDGRHRRVVLDGLARCFKHELDESALRAIARENFRRIGENFACAVKTAAMTSEQLKPHFDFTGEEKILPHDAARLPQSRVVAIGHFGNFELYARFGQYVRNFRCATTYRGLRQPSLNRLMQDLRERSGCQFFERRRDAAALKAAMTETGLLLGLLSDQHAGDRGLPLPFFGEICSTSAAPAVLALRYHCPLHTAICYRTGLAHWRIEVGDEIPTEVEGQARPPEDIMRDVNAAFELAIRRDPANWFWVHKRWKPGKHRAGKPTDGESASAPKAAQA